MSISNLNLSVTFWGEEYRRYFVDYCLASLLSDGNLPAISDPASARFLIATTDADWAALQLEPLVIAASRYVSFEHVSFEVHSLVTSDEKMMTMSQAHRQLAERMHARRAYGVFLYPDVVLATGYIAGLERLAREGVKVALVMSIRHSHEGLRNALIGQGAERAGRIAVSPQQLVRLAIANMHSEVRRSGFESKYYDVGTVTFFWVVKTGENLLFHAGNWVPALIDYRAIRQHDLTTFTNYTLDGDYVARNFPDPADVYVVEDTSEICMVSFTPEEKVSYSLRPYTPYQIASLRRLLKIQSAHEVLYKRGYLDPIKRASFKIPIRMIGGYSGEDEWQAAEQRAAHIVKAIERGCDPASPLVVQRILRTYVRIFDLLRTLWFARRAILRRLAQMLRGDAMAWRRVGWRARQQFSRLLGRSFDERPPDGPAEMT